MSQGVLFRLYPGSDRGRAKGTLTLTIKLGHQFMIHGKYRNQSMLLSF